MDIILEVIIAFFICTIVVLLITAVKGSILTPVRVGKGVHISVVIHVCGDAEQLEETIDGLLWTCKNSSPNMKIIIVDDGLCEEARKRIELLARESMIINFCTTDKVTFCGESE